MFAFIAAVIFVLGLIFGDFGVKSLAFWLLLGLTAWALHASGIESKLPRRRSSGN